MVAPMEITSVKVFPASKEDEKLKGFATITIDDCFVVRDLKIINGTNGLFVAMPSRKKPDGTFADIAHPLNSRVRGVIEGLVIAAYQHEVTHNGTNGKALVQPRQL